MPRILIVDDEGGIRSMLARAFSRAAYEVRTAADGAEAMALVESEPFDVLLSDVLHDRFADQAAEDAVLFSFSDRPAQKALGIWREEA